LTNGEDLKREAQWIRQRINELISQGLSREEVIGQITSDLQSRFPGLSKDTIKKYVEYMIGKAAGAGAGGIHEEEWIGRYNETKGRWEKTRIKCKGCGETGSVYRHVTSAGKIDKLYCDKCGKYFLKTGGRFHYASPEFKKGKVKGHEFVEMKEGIMPPTSKGGSIHGFVRDKTDNKPIAGARVYIPIPKYMKLRAKTDKHGYYKIDNVTLVGEFPLRAGARGYFTQDVAVQRVRGQKIQVCDFLLQPKPGGGGNGNGGGKGKGKGHVKLFNVTLSPFILFIIGMILSAILRNIWFFFAFLCFAVHSIISKPDDIKGRVVEVMGVKLKIFQKDERGIGAGCFKHIFLTLGFILLSLSFMTSPIPLAQPIGLIVAFIAYFGLGSSVSDNFDFNYAKAGFKSLFGIFIAVAFGLIFESVFLAILAAAFLVFMPEIHDKDEPDKGKGLKIANKIFFIVLMLAVVIFAFSASSATWGLDLDFGGSIAPWTWNTSAIIFMGIWFVSFLVGAVSDLQSRQAVGVMMIIITFIFFAAGPGGQNVGTAFFGPWWPSVHEYGLQVFGPMGDALSAITKPISDGWMLLTDPVGYATRLMNGTYAYNPMGATGAYGIEITDITLSPVYPEQPFMLTALLKNSGAFNAEKVKVELFTSFEKLTLADLGIEETVQYLGGEENYEKTKFIKEYVEQFTFNSDGISCDIVESKKLREKYVPLRVNVTYGYQSDSEVDVEFISQNEWERLAQANRLSQELKFIKSQYSSAPVAFPIGTPGIKNPILVDKPFHFGLRLEPAQGKVSKGGSGIKSVEEVRLEYPSDFELDARGCAPKPYKGPESSSDGKANVITWSNFGFGSKVFYCYFRGLKPEKLTGPTKTYIVRAHANYTFEKWKEKDLKIEFGGRCCSKNECLGGQECVDGMCVEKGVVVTAHPPKDGVSSPVLNIP